MSRVSEVTAVLKWRVTLSGLNGGFVDTDCRTSSREGTPDAGSARPASTQCPDKSGLFRAAMDREVCTLPRV